MIKNRITVDLKRETKPFKHFFGATGYANSDFTYTPAVMRMYDHLASYKNHPQYMRLHNIMTSHGQGDRFKFEFHSDYGNPPDGQPSEDIVVSRDGSGRLSYDWTIVDRVYDIILSHEMKPIVEMCFIPTAIRNPEYPCMPLNYHEYYSVCRAFVEHWTEKYGRKEVRTWWFEVTNEPDNYEIFAKRPEYFLAMYDNFEAAVHDVDPLYRAGGPAVKQWEQGHAILDAFLNHCDNGINYVNGNIGTRVDFISVHCKAGLPGMVGPQMSYMFDTLREYISAIKQHPKFDNTPFFNDESDIVWDGNRGTAYKSWLDFRNTEYAPAFICKMVNHYSDVVEDELGMNLAVVDSDNCHLLWETHLFSGNRSQLTPLGDAPSSDLIKKGFFNAGHMLSLLGDERYTLEDSNEEFGDKFGCLATKFRDGGYAFMLWNAEDGLASDMNERNITLQLEGIEGDWDVIVHRIDRDHSNAYSTWKKQGRPIVPSSQDANELRENDSLFVEDKSRRISSQKASFEFDMPMHSVVMVSLAKPQVEEEHLEFVQAETETNALGSKQLFLRWKYSERKDLLGYNIYRDDRKLNGKLLTASTYVDSDVTSGQRYEYWIEVIYSSSQKSMKKTEVVCL